MKWSAALVSLCLAAVACVGCETRTETHDGKPKPAKQERQTIGIKLIPPEEGPGLDIAVSLPKDYEPRSVVNSISTIIHRAMTACGKDGAALRLSSELHIALMLDGDKVSGVEVAPVPERDCLKAALTKQKLPKPAPKKVDVQLLLRPVAAPSAKP